MLYFNNKNETELGSVGENRNRPPKFSGDADEVLRLTADEIRVYKKCSNDSLLKAGLPFAIIADVVTNYFKKKSGDAGPIETNSPLTKQLNLKRGMLFLGNILFGSFLYTPYCYKKLKGFHADQEKRKMIFVSKNTTAHEESNAKTQPEDFSYPTDITTNIGEYESSFSADFNSSNLILEDTEKPKTPSVTYDELRTRNRDHFRAQRPVNSLQVNDSPRLTTPPEPKNSDPPPRRVKRNIYGDEIE